MLEIINLRAKVEDREILRGVNLTVGPGEVHAIMGPNGSGKSTLANVLAGRDAYEVTGGEVMYDGQDLLEMDPEVRSFLFTRGRHPVLERANGRLGPGLASTAHRRHRRPQSR